MKKAIVIPSYRAEKTLPSVFPHARVFLGRWGRHHSQ